MPVHPVGFLVLTVNGVFGIPVSGKSVTLESFGLSPERLKLVEISPKAGDSGELLDIAGLVQTLDGPPSDNPIASRIGGFSDVSEAEKQPGILDAELIAMILSPQLGKHNSYQNFDKFLSSGGSMGLQTDMLPYGTYAVNPLLVQVEEMPIVSVRQGEVAVVRANEGLPSVDMSGEDFKHGSIVRPGHQGLWREPLRVGKYALNPRAYSVEKVPTSIISLNWSELESHAHDLDSELSSIHAVSQDGFPFVLDLVVQIHVADTNASRVISRVGSFRNLINEVLQGAVGNYFRETLQGMSATQFIKQRKDVQERAYLHIQEMLQKYNVELVDVLIQDVKLPDELTKVLQQREIAQQEQETYQMQTAAEEKRSAREKAKGEADMQSRKMEAEVGVEIAQRRSEARKQEADGDAYYAETTGKAQAAAVRANGIALAESWEAQQDALGQNNAAIIEVMKTVGANNIRITQDILTTGGGSDSGGGLMALVMATLAKQLHSEAATPAAKP